MEEDRTLDNLIRKAERLRILNKCVLMLQLPVAIFTRTPSGLENYLNSEFAAIVALGAGIITGTTAGIELHVERDKPLIYTGIYGIVRNPIHLSFRLCSLGAFLYNPSVENIITGGALLLTTELTARAEERRLEYMYPNGYKQYKERVSRWIPFGGQIRNRIQNAFNYFRNSSSN